MCRLPTLTDQQAESFVKNWYVIVEKGLAIDPEQGEIIGKEKAAELVETLKEPEFRARRVFSMIRNPLLLANLCLVHFDRKKLPQRRSDLYEECVDVLLERWREAKALRSTITAKTGRRVLQPAALWLHQEEWEYACRAGASTEYCSGDGLEALKKVGWCSYDSKYGSAGSTKPVGSFSPKEWGLFDMHGNVWEWLEDDSHGNYQNAPIARKRESFFSASFTTFAVAIGSITGISKPMITRWPSTTFVRTVFTVST